MSSVEFHPTKVLLLNSLNDQLNEQTPLTIQIHSPSKLIYGTINAVEFELGNEGPFYLLTNVPESTDGLMLAIQQNNGQSPCQFFGMSVFEFAESFGRYEAERMEAEQWESDNAENIAPPPGPGRIDSSSSGSDEPPQPKRRRIVSSESGEWLGRPPYNTDSSVESRPRRKLRWDSEENILSHTESEEEWPPRRNARQLYESLSGMDGNMFDSDEGEDWQSEGDTDYGSCEDEQEEEEETEGEEAAHEQSPEYDGDEEDEA